MTESEQVTVAREGPVPTREGEWVVTLDVENGSLEGTDGELTVRALAAVVAGRRTYVTSRTSGYSFTVIVATAGAPAALGRAIAALEAAQRAAGLPAAAVVCAEVTLVGNRPVPAAATADRGCENPAS